MSHDTASVVTKSRPMGTGRAMRDPTVRFRVFLVEDSAPMREHTRLLLEEHFDVIAFADGAEALAAAQGEPPDLVLTDARMPGFTGLDLLRALRDEERTRDIPVILISALADEDAIVAGLDTGADDYVCKPFAPRELLARVRTHLELGRERRSWKQQLRRATLELEEFVYVASHDLQEPLRMVRSYVQLLEKRYRGQLDADADTYIHYAVDGAARMQGLINDLLRLSRLDSEAKPAVYTDLQALFDSVLAELKIGLPDDAGTITSDPLPFVMADGGQLGLVLGNLLANAVKFRKLDEPARVHVSAERDGIRWIVSVRDNGIGIDPRHADRVFRLFQRLHTRTEYPGNGIGLPLCKKAIERAGGRIWVESDEGAGATFRFTVAAAPEIRA